MVDGDFSAINKKLLNVVSFNVNSLTHGSRLEQLEALCREVNADVICLQETKMDETVSPSVYHLEGSLGRDNLCPIELFMQKNTKSMDIFYIKINSYKGIYNFCLKLQFL